MQAGSAKEPKRQRLGTMQTGFVEFDVIFPWVLATHWKAEDRGGDKTRGYVSRPGAEMI
jgi:hypothetical protein